MASSIQNQTLLLRYLIPAVIATIVIYLFAASNFRWVINISKEQFIIPLPGGAIGTSPDQPSTRNKGTKPRAILHIGSHKIASTYIQTNLCNELDLLQQIGFAVPIAKSCKGRCIPKHFAGVAFELQGKVDLASRQGCSPTPVNDLMDCLKSQNGSVILSAEDFDNLDDHAVAQLAGILSEYDTTVVMLYRRKFEHIMSYYTQTSKDYVSPMSFKEFFWWMSSLVDPNAGPDTPIETLGGLCYKRLVELYGRHFGKENLVIINYNGLKIAGADPWEVLMKEVIGYKDYQPLRDDKERKNVSPDPFLLSVASHYYSSVWLNDSINNNAKSSIPPDVKCILPLLKPLADILPRVCTNLGGVCSLWEIQELEYFTSLQGTLQLLYFDRDSKNDLIFQEMNQTACDIDTGKLKTHADKMQYASVLEKVHAQINTKCSKKDLDLKRNTSG